MRDIEIATDTTARGAGRAVELTRRQLIILALLACVPLPLLSVATTVIPFPEIIERAAAQFLPFGEATASADLAYATPGRDRATGVRKAPVHVAQLSAASGGSPSKTSTASTAGRLRAGR